MASSYVNDLRLNEMATGDASGTWGTVTNTNLELIGEALGFGTEAITTNADTHTSTVADGATDPVRAMFVKYTGTLDSSCTITIAPNTLNRMHFIENGTSGGQNIIISQGSGANVTIPPSDTKAVYLNGAGSGAAVVDAFASLNVVDLKVQDDLFLTSDSAVLNIGEGNDLKITHDGTNGDFESAGNLTFDVAGDIILDADGKDYLFKDAGTLIATMSSDNTDFTIRSEVSNRDLKFEGNDNGANVTALILDMSDAGSATFSHNVKLPDNGVVALGAGSDLSLSSNGTHGTIAAPNGDLTIDVANDLIIDVDNGRVFLKDGGTTFGRLANASTDFEIVSVVQDKDILFKGNDGGSEITALTLDMSNQGNAIFKNDIDQPNVNSFIKGAGHNIIQTDANTTYFYGGVNGVQFRTADNAAENITFSNAGAAVFNEQGNDADFRVESDADANCLFIDGGNNVVGINNNVMSSMSTDSNNLVVGSGSGNEGMTIYSATNGTGNIYFADGSSGGDRYRGILEYTHSNDSLGTYTGGVERMRMGNDGATKITSLAGSNYVLRLHNDRNNNDGYGLHLQVGADDPSGTHYQIDFADGDGTLQGSISSNSGTVTYGAFTAFHPCIIPNADNDPDSVANAYPYGTLLEITSLSYTQKNGADTERGILYNVQKSSSAKSKAVLGAYGSSMNSEARGDTNLHQALILGDGHILCNNENGNIAVGDYICTSSVSGEGMKATNICATIGVAREAISFANSTAVLVVVEYGYRQFVPEDLEARIVTLENA